ncbi:MAG: acyl-CoA dehydrogenase family protein [Pontiellaceae bacterium]|nr:acyl-CoA dehydrogenase family protein [Pontiellaceae bacterium]
MDYNLSEELKIVRDTARRFANHELAPISQECDRQERYTPEIRIKAAGLGLVGAWIPEAYGGSGFGFLGNAIITEELSRVDMGIGLNIVVAPFGSEAIHFFGTQEQKQRYLPPLCRGEQVSAGAFTEPNAGTDVSGIGTRAVKDGADYVINGSKMFITNGTVCDFYVVLAITHPEAAKKHERYSMIIVPRETAGVSSYKITGKMGIRASDTAEVVFDNVRVSRENLLGTEGRGFYQVMHFFDVTRVMVSAQGIGLAQGCLEAAIRYAGERKVFGQALGTYQLTQAKITEMAVRIEALRNMVYKAAWLIDQETPDYTLAAMAKYLGGQTAVYCANAAMEIHGGYGYIDEYIVQKWYRDAKVLEIYEGTKEAEIMTIGKTLMMR